MLVVLHTGVSVIICRITNYSPDMSRADQDSSFLSAVKMWSDATPLKFTRVDRGPADIVLTFARRSKVDDTKIFFPGYESSFISGCWSDKELCLFQLMETSTPLMVREECWLMPFSRGRGLEETCTLMRMKSGRMGDEVSFGWDFSFLHFRRRLGKPFVARTPNPKRSYNCKHFVMLARLFVVVTSL